MNQNQFLLDSGFWGWLYKLLYPVEWLMTQIMAVFHKFLVMLGMNEIGFSWVMSIVFLVLVVQACVFPLFYKSMKGMRKMQAQMTVLQPKMQRIQNKYKGKNDPASKEAMQREMMKLYQDNDANPMGGCTSMLPMFVQGPVFMCMFYTLSAIPYIARGKFRDGQGLGAFDIATAKQFTSTTVFGVNVADNFTTAAVHGKVVIAIFVALMCFCLWFMQYNSMKRNMAQSAANKQTEMMQKMMLWMFPIMYIFSGIAMPFAVLVYWLTNNICNLLRSIWQIHVFPTPGSPAAEAKEKRDHVHENARRAKAGLPSLEEEALQKAKEAAEGVLEQIDLIKKAILARAFRGELGTNDPSEDSAIKLLERSFSETIESEKVRHKQVSKQRAEVVFVPKTIMEALSTGVRLTPESLKRETELQTFRS